MPAALFRALVLVNCGLLPVALGMSDLERGDITIDVHVLRTQSVKAICELARQLTAADRVANDTLLLAAANASAAVQLQKAAEGRAAGARWRCRLRRQTPRFSPPIRCRLQATGVCPKSLLRWMRCCRR
ncbi:hypothetical protein ERJ75_000011500 [Trypanosoma vivax]|nr:hypothetical protein ERJ75_000011500 [Trypanosoma vivax]